MTVKIRLARGGRKKIARYRIVVADSRFKRDGRYLEAVGFYNPQMNPKEFNLNLQRVGYWLKNGAELSETVHNLMKQDRFDEKLEAVTKGLSLETLNVSRRPERKRKAKVTGKKQKTAS